MSTSSKLNPVFLQNACRDIIRRINGSDLMDLFFHFLINKSVLIKEDYHGRFEKNNK